MKICIRKRHFPATKYGLLYISIIFFHTNSSIMYYLVDFFQICTDDQAGMFRCSLKRILQSFLPELAIKLYVNYRNKLCCVTPKYLGHCLAKPFKICTNVKMVLKKGILFQTSAKRFTAYCYF
jgi:hypothetical protein